MISNTFVAPGTPSTTNHFGHFTDNRYNLCQELFNYKQYPNNMYYGWVSLGSNHYRKAGSNHISLKIDYAIATQISPVSTNGHPKMIETQVEKKIRARHHIIYRYPTINLASKCILKYKKWIKWK